MAVGSYAVAWTPAFQGNCCEAAPIRTCLQVFCFRYRNNDASVSESNTARAVLLLRYCTT